MKITHLAESVGKTVPAVIAIQRKYGLHTFHDHSHGYAVCGANTRNMLDGPTKILLCISKRTGRVLRRMSIRSGG